MDAYITPSGGARTQFPMMPEKISLGADAKFMTYSIISLGDVKIPRGKGIKEISWSGIFPGKPRKNNPLVAAWIAPDTLIKRMEQYRDNGTVCNLLVTGTCINYSVYVSSFKGKYTGGSGDFQYEIKFIIATEIKIYTTKELKIKTPAKTKRTASKKSQKKSSSGSKTTTYTAKSCDTLSRIALKQLGKAARYPEIYKLNKNKIESEAKKHGKKSSNNGHWIYPGTKLTIPKK
ncbi:MAG: LysM peptidoglycan-binding domain-containing protein [Eubacteriales bacterium]|nr:LysM peptidoglycan-binding domain-containing protein [Eubacteriales bacterium]